MRVLDSLALLRAMALIPALVLAAGASAKAAEPLRSASSFDSISNPQERSRALFIEAGRVIQSPRCLNCHPSGDRPYQGQGVELRLHVPNVTRGVDNKGAVALRCTSCHQEKNNESSGVPGHPLWHMAPREMGWVGVSLGGICEQIKDPRRNGGKTLAQIHEHMAHDPLVGWGWMPGAHRDPAPGTQAQLGELIDAWIKTGAVCPN